MPTLHKDDTHCSGLILARSGHMLCAKAETCLRYTEHVRKLDKFGDRWYLRATTDCGEHLANDQASL
jgi:hypothetical protein